MIIFGGLKSLFVDFFCKYKWMLLSKRIIIIVSLKKKKQGNYGYDNRGSDTKLYYMLSEHGNVSSWSSFRVLTLLINQVWDRKHSLFYTSNLFYYSSLIKLCMRTIKTNFLTFYKIQLVTYLISEFEIARTFQ